MELKVIDNKGKETKTIQFDEKLVETKVSKALLHEVIVAYNANQRSGTHSTLTRTEVSGGGTKPWKQKGTGNARSGSNRSPLWRHGGIIFGPKPRDYRQDLPKQKKKQAFKLAVHEMIKDNRLQVVDPISITEPKTKNVAQIYSKWQAPTDSLYIVDKIDSNLQRAARNINHVKVSNVASLNTYDCLGARKIFITPAALEELSVRLSGEKV